MGSRSFRYVPLLVFGAAYAVSCLAGALFLLLEYEPFVALFEYFSGTAAPELSAAERRTNILLLVAAPLALTAGYVLGARVHVDRLDRPEAGAAPSAPHWLAPVVFAVLAAAGVVSLARVGTFGRLDTWGDYGAWVASRAETFARLSFAEFVNLYVLVPVAAAWVAISALPRTPFWTAVRWLPTPISLALSAMLFTRKSVVTALLIVLFAVVIHAARNRSGVRRLIVGGIAVVALAYATLVVIPVYRESASTVTQAAERARLASDPERAARLNRVAGSFGLRDRRRALFLYAALSPLTRSSAPALAYPVVFPRLHDYYAPDMGQDVAGLGTMPDDNVVVWNHLNPNTPGGTTAVPFQFVLYSQGGTAVALIGSVLVGLLLAVMWRLSRRAGGEYAVLLGSMVLLLAVYLAIDSLRNSLLVSYGVVWGAAFVGLAALLSRLTRRQGRATMPTNQPKRLGSLAASGPPTLRSYGVTKRS